MIDLKNIADKLEEFDTQKVCAIIVTAKYFNGNAGTISACMAELSKRREGGDDFDFEEFIDDELRKLPQISTEALDLRKIVGSFL